ncbi:hypothetical protein BDN70DRAFT_916926 [Pholiota conissans]|uniref:Uncharacterized protein n=1 Tax=Pholiota conissans TaxID=109636 RepID=A0A9P5ZD69_9AGAR|nr:hypothetical protein BDN70DRAFT_916926 [Pholiota conissans]
MRSLPSPAPCAPLLAPHTSLPLLRALRNSLRSSPFLDDLFLFLLTHFFFSRPLQMSVHKEFKPSTPEPLSPRKIAARLNNLFSIYRCILAMETDGGWDDSVRQVLGFQTSEIIRHLYSDTFNSSMQLKPSDRKAIAHSCGINHILMSQYAKKQAKLYGLPYKSLKLCLTPSEKLSIARCFQKAKHDFDQTRNKPHRQSTFRAPRADRLRGKWSGYQARTSIFQHHLVRNSCGWLFKRPKTFKNFPYSPKHPYFAGRRPVPHLQYIHPTTKKHCTKLTKEYPMLELGVMGCVPSASDIASRSNKGLARTLISFSESVIRFEGVVAHVDTMSPLRDRGNHYWASYSSNLTGPEEEKDEFSRYYLTDVIPARKRELQSLE